MKKNIQELKNSITYIGGRIQKMQEAKNSVSDEARTEVEITISKLQEVEAALKAALEAAEQGDENHDDELRAQLAELKRTVSEIENAVNAAKTTVENVKKIANTKDFVTAFIGMVNNTVEPRDFKAAWNAKAKSLISNGISDTNINNGDLLPGFIVNEINDAFVGRRHRLLELVDWTGLPMWKTLWETENDLGHVHTRGEAKTEQDLEFTPIEIRPDYIYKYLTVDQVVMRETRDMNDVLLKYVTRELLDRLLTTVENYICTGTGPFIAPLEVEKDQNVIKAGFYTQDVDGVVAIMSKSVYYNLEVAIEQLVGNGGRIVTEDDVCAYLGVTEIILNEATYTPTTAGATWTGITYLVPRDYKLVGDKRPDQYEDFNLAYNKKEFLTEIYLGGGCVVPNNFVTLYTL